MCEHISNPRSPDDLRDFFVFRILIRCLQLRSSPLAFFAILYQQIAPYYVRVTWILILIDVSSTSLFEVSRFWNNIHKSTNIVTTFSSQWAYRVWDTPTILTCSYLKSFKYVELNKIIFLYFLNFSTVKRKPKTTNRSRFRFNFQRTTYD